MREKKSHESTSVTQLVNIQCKCVHCMLLQQMSGGFKKENEMLLQWSRPLRQIEVVRALSGQQGDRLRLTWVQKNDRDLQSCSEERRCSMHCLPVNDSKTKCKAEKICFSKCY